MIEKQWKIISTSYKIEYTLGAVQKFSRMFYLIKNSNGDKIARTDRCLLELGKTDKVKIPKLNQRLGVIKSRPAFQLHLTWEITVNNETVIPTYSCMEPLQQ